MNGFNQTQAEFPGDKTLHRFFEEQVEQTPGKPAALFKKQIFTYRELNEKANQMARLLRQKGVKPDHTVAIMVERSLEMMVGLMAILKSGGAYLPVSPDYPGKRINHMLMDSSTKILLTQGKFVEKIEANLDMEIEIINLEAEANYRESPINLPHINGPMNLAYVIYTSGSTGKPKGVMIEHRSVVNRLHWMQKKYPLDENDTILQKTPYFFDVSVWELFWWSMVGASVCFLLPGFERFPQAIVETVETSHITTMHFVPSMMSAFLGYIENSGDIPRLASLNRVFCSGEALKPAHVERFNKTLYQHNDTRLINLYGPTEATVDVSYFDCSTESGETDIQCIPIGKPIDNIQLYIMDEDSREQPVGTEGELSIAGVGLARGYLNRPVLTAEKFVEKEVKVEVEGKSHELPEKINQKFLQGVQGGGFYKKSPPGRRRQKLYRTGDLARWLPDGNIEFLGRLDFQVKIRGLRIELGEIESILSNHPAVQDCVVLVKETTETIINLVAYMVTKTEFSQVELKKYMKSLLPDYMVPSEFVVLEALPLTPSGKVDRKKLRG
ncbi:MAG: amino acid adenylation domain-containing protein [Candidatus Aminicenantes bacterium]|jgi:amino acid adenylation domain-containing protein